MEVWTEVHQMKNIYTQPSWSPRCSLLGSKDICQVYKVKHTIKIEIWNHPIYPACKMILRYISWKEWASIYRYTDNVPTLGVCIQHTNMSSWCYVGKWSVSTQFVHRRERWIKSMLFSHQRRIHNFCLCVCVHIHGRGLYNFRWVGSDLINTVGI